MSAAVAPEEGLQPLRATEPLVVRTVAVADPGPLLDLLPEPGGLAWTRRGEGLVGWGEAARCTPCGAGRFAQAQDWWRRLVDTAVVRDEVARPGTGLVAFGSFAFDDDVADAGEHPGGSVLVVPRVLVGHRGGRWWVTTVGTAALPPAAALRAAPPPRRPSGWRFADASGTAWTSVVAEAVRRIGHGEVDKVVLARELDARTDAPLDVRWPLRRLAEGYPGCWTFAVEGLFGATPEMLVRRERGLVTSRVLAGTIRRSGDDERDLALAASLARSSKDLEEHEYAVRSVADALAPHCSSMNVPETPFVLHLPNVMHLATDVAGVLADDTPALGLVASLHPSAAVCGTPTAAAGRLIREIEGIDRGRYAGPVGWTGADGDGEWGIALRCAQVDPDEPSLVRLYAGCGIVAGSDPQAELAESAAKLVPVRDALGS